MAIEHLEDLRVFAQVVDSGSMTAASRVVGLSPTLVSRRLARLEDALGVRLLQRTTRHLHVTDEGRVFYSRTKRILADVEAAEQEVRPAANEVAGVVRAVLPTSMLAYGIMDALGEFLREHPGLSVELRLSDAALNLTAGGWDVATYIGIPEDSGHIARRICHFSPALGATVEYLARAGIPEHPLDLANHKCLPFRPDEHWPIIDREGVTHRIPVGGALTCHDLVTQYAAMKAGIGIGILPRSILERDIEDGVLMDALPGCQLVGVTLFALMPAGRHRLPRVRAFTDWFAAFLSPFDDGDLG